MSRFVLMQIGRMRQFAHHVLPQSLRRRDTGAIFAMLVIFGFVVTLQQVQALDLSLEGMIQGAAYMLFAIANLFIGLTVFCLRFFIALASYNNYIDVPIVKLGWAMVRDVANMFFVVALLVIAFATILGYEQYEWKRGMVKLVLMAIFINFSNLIAQLVIDVAHVFTMTFLNAVSATAGGNLINMFNLDEVMKMATGSSSKAWESSTEASITIFATALFAVFYSVMALVSIGSYAIVMALRVVVLWTLIILSPLAYVFYAMPKGEKYAQEWWSEFSKHVIVAPIMVFFLWLSFATLGAGNVLSDIQDDIPPSHKLQTGQTEVSMALSEVSTWEKFANFLVAFAFLMIGLQKTKESGVQGAGMVGSASNLGKKVAMGVTGITAARFLGRKGLEKGKEFGIKKAKNLAMPVYGSVQKQWQKAQRKRVGWAADLNKKAKAYKDEGGVAGFAKSAGFRLATLLPQLALEVGTGRGDKKAEDWSKAIERDKERTRENFSTSSTTGGQYKLEASVRLDQDKARGQAKKEQKEKEIAEKLLGSDASYISSREGQLVAQSRADAAKGSVDVVEMSMKQAIGDTGKKIFEDIESGARSKDSLKDKEKAALDFYKSGKREQRSKAEAEVIQLQFDKAKVLHQSAYFADEKGGNDPLKAALLQQKAGSMEFNKLIDVIKESGANANERANISATLTKNMKDLLASNGGNENDPQLAMLRQRKAAITAYNATQGSYDSEHAHHEALEKAGWTEEINDGNAIRRFLTEQTGKVVGQTDDVKKVWDEWTASLGKDKDAILRQLALSGKNQIGQFNETMAALFKEGVDTNGMTTYSSIDDMDDTAVAKKIDETVRSWINADNVDVNKANSAAINRDKNGDVLSITEKQAQRNAMLVKGKTAHGIGSIRGGMFGDLDDLKDEGQIRIQLEEFAKVLDKDAFTKSIVSRMKTAVSQAKLSSSDIEKIWNDINK